MPNTDTIPTPARSEAEGRQAGSIPHVTAGELAAMVESARARPTVREVMARVLGEADAAQYRPSGNRPSLTALAEMEREQRVFAALRTAAEKVAATRNCASRPAPTFKLTIYGLEKVK